MGEAAGQRLVRSSCRLSALPAIGRRILSGGSWRVGVWAKGELVVIRAVAGKSSVKQGPAFTVKVKMQNLRVLSASSSKL